ncbi:DUF6055 domain-containing protein [Sporocytophaga myxococcoides]|uniref:DUF6055 domain-containing protein n=1 Tax=Sporocytophaga myxococcoides TaxID=153721 RepID=UPI0003FE0F76|nr:DUF6055 domain-containing protein [Sporocytophaga myxococcoides]
MKKTLLCIFFIYINLQLLYAQKTVFTPTEWSNPGHEYYGRMASSRMYESKNFVLYWGDLVGTNPQSASDANLRFNPVAVADTFEFIFNRFITDLKFINNAPTTNFGKYKTPVIILGTFSGGDDRTTGFAHASSYSNTLGAMFVHPSAVKDGGAISHEYAHALQMMMRIQENPGNGNAFSGYDWAGPFFEGHANYMRAQVYQKWANIDGTLTRWIQTRHFMWSSNRHHYTNYNLLFYVQQTDGFEMTRRLWAESKNQEHPLETLKRLKGFTQEQLNDYLYGYASRDVTFDYPIQWNSTVNQNSNFGKVMRQTYQGIKNSLPRYTSRQYTLLDKVQGTTDHFFVNENWAPQDYGMNIIPLYPTCTGTDKTVSVKFKGHTEVNPTYAGWRYGFVTTKTDGTVSRYSPMYSSADGEASFNLNTASETNIYLVVFSAPKIHSNYNMDVGYPKYRRYPYELKIANAVPEGYQASADFRKWRKTNGKLHSNGGGWISNNANVASTAYVGPYAMVLGSTVSGNARIEGFATVEGGNVSGNAVVKDNAAIYNATISGDAVISGNAWMEGGTVTNTAQVKGNAMVWSATYGNNVIVGGDAEVGSCSTNGVYLQPTYWRNGRTECDGKGATDASNVDINSGFTNFTANQMAFTATPACTTVALKTYTLSVSVVGSGTVTPTSGTYDEGTTVILSAKPASGYLFTGWSGNASGTTNPLSVIMDANKTITATFTAIPIQTITYTAEMQPMSDYTPTVISLNSSQIRQIFGLTAAQITSEFANKTIKYFGVNTDGTLDSVSTANAPGHWYNKTGAITTYGTNAYIYSELDMSKLVANVGQYPGKVMDGESYTFKQALVYTKSATDIKQITLVFNISITSVITGLDEANDEVRGTIYPNPSSESFKVELSRPSDISVYSLDGQKLVEYKNVRSVVFGDQLKAGTYLVKTGNKFYKIVKE